MNGWFLRIDEQKLQILKIRRDSQLHNFIEKDDSPCTLLSINKTYLQETSIFQGIISLSLFSFIIGG